MATSIDALQIEISAKATSANNAINRLTKNLDKLSTSLNSLNVSNVGGLSTVANQTNAVASGSTKMNNALKKTNTTMKTTSKQAWSLARAFGKFYANYFLIIRGAKALWGSIEGTADYIESFNYYTVAFGKIASQWDENWDNYGSEGGRNYANSFVTSMNDTISKLSGVQIQLSDDYTTGILTDTGLKNLGLNIQEITQYASQLASVTNSLGQTGETSLAISQSFTKLAGDISSLFNVDYSTVSKNLQSGLIGQSRALYKYGIDITNATLQTYAYKLGLSKAVSEMTQAEKQQLRTIAILDQSKVSWGDLANTINSPSNMIRQLSTNLKEAGMVLGQLFVPMLENVLPVVNGATIALKRLLTEIAGFFGVEINFKKFGQGYNELEEDNSDLSDSYDDLASSIEEVKSQLLGFDEVNKLSDTSATLSVGTEDNTIDLTDEIVSATEEYQKVWDEAFANMENTSQKWADRVQKALDGVGTVFEDFAVGDFFKAGEDTSKLVIEFNEFISKAISEIDWQGIGEDIGAFLTGIDWVGVAKSLGKVVVNLVKSSLELTYGIASRITDEIIQGIYGLMGKTPDLPDITIGSQLGNFFNDIDKDFEYYDKIAEEYLTLSSMYDMLTQEEKNLVKQYSNILKDNIDDITGYIDEITGAWKGTNEQLEQAIRNTEKYYKRLAYEKAKQKLYEIEANLKIEAGQVNATLEELEQKIYDSIVKMGGQELLDESFKTNLGYLKGHELISKYSRFWRFGGYDADLLGEYSTALHTFEEYNEQLGEVEDHLDYIDDLMDDFVESTRPAQEEIKKIQKNVGKIPTNITFNANTGPAIKGAQDIEVKVNKIKSPLITPTLNSVPFSTSLASLVAASNLQLSKVQATVKVDADTSPFIDKINKARQKLEEFEQKSNASSAVSSIFNASINAWSGIKGFANGGFVDEGQLFIAREAGPELVGSMGGRTAVANNDQITQGIAQAVYSAFTSALSATNRGSSGDIIVNIDGKQVFKAVQKQATNYVAQTGQTPFPI